MSTCRYITKALVLAFFALNAFNVFSNPAAATARFKEDYSSFEQTIKSRLGFALPQQIQSSHVGKYAFEIVYYSAIAQLLFSIIGVFCGISSSIAAIIWFKFQAIHLNYFKINFNSTAELEKYALPISLLIGVLALDCCGSSSAKCGKKSRNSEHSESSAQANTKKRH